MPRYAALLRGVLPTNAKMPALRAAFEAAGFGDVKTVLGSGNVVFTARGTNEDALAKKAERAMEHHLGRSFPTFVRSIDALSALVARDPFSRVRLPPGARRVVTFLRAPRAEVPGLPKTVPGACIHHLEGREVFTSYTRTPKGPVFMDLLKKTFGEDITTRTWETVLKLLAAK